MINIHRIKMDILLCVYTSTYTGLIKHLALAHIKRKRQPVSLQPTKSNKSSGKFGTHSYIVPPFTCLLTNTRMEFKFDTNITSTRKLSHLKKFGYANILTDYTLYIIECDIDSIDVPSSVEYRSVGRSEFLEIFNFIERNRSSKNLHKKLIAQRLLGSLGLQTGKILKNTFIGQNDSRYFKSIQCSSKANAVIWLCIPRTDKDTGAPTLSLRPIQRKKPIRPHACFSSDVELSDPFDELTHLYSTQDTGKCDNTFQCSHELKMYISTPYEDGEYDGYSCGMCSYIKTMYKNEPFAVQNIDEIIDQAIQIVKLFGDEVVKIDQVIKKGMLVFKGGVGQYLYKEHKNISDISTILCAVRIEHRIEKNWCRTYFYPGSSFITLGRYMNGICHDNKAHCTKEMLLCLKSVILLLRDFQYIEKSFRHNELDLDHVLVCQENDYTFQVHFMNFTHVSFDKETMNRIGMNEKHRNTDTNQCVDINRLFSSINVLLGAAEQLFKNCESCSDAINGICEQVIRNNDKNTITPLDVSNILERYLIKSTLNLRHDEDCPEHLLACLRFITEESDPKQLIDTHTFMDAELKNCDFCTTTWTRFLEKLHESNTDELLEYISSEQSINWGFENAPLPCPKTSKTPIMDIPDVNTCDRDFKCSGKLKNNIITLRNDDNYSCAMCSYIKSMYQSNRFTEEKVSMIIEHAKMVYQRFNDEGDVMQLVGVIKKGLFVFLVGDTPYIYKHHEKHVDSISNILCLLKIKHTVKGSWCKTLFYPQPYKTLRSYMEDIVHDNDANCTNGLLLCLGSVMSLLLDFQTAENSFRHNDMHLENVLVCVCDNNTIKVKFIDFEHVSFDLEILLKWGINRTYKYTNANKYVDLNKLFNNIQYFMDKKQLFGNCESCSVVMRNICNKVLPDKYKITMDPQKHLRMSVVRKEFEGFCDTNGEDTRQTAEFTTPGAVKEMLHKLTQVNN